jgi:hypothetical protein
LISTIGREHAIEWKDKKDLVDPVTRVWWARISGQIGVRTGLASSGKLTAALGLLADKEAHLTSRHY